MHLNINQEVGLILSEIEPGKMDTLLLRLRPELFITFDYFLSTGFVTSNYQDFEIAYQLKWFEDLVCSISVLFKTFLYLLISGVFNDQLTTEKFIPPVSPFARNTTYLLNLLSDQNDVLAAFYSNDDGTDEFSSFISLCYNVPSVCLLLTQPSTSRVFDLLENRSSKLISSSLFILY